MIEWNLFYKMLGIPEEVTEPTFYDLLGLHPETCCAELVDRMLHTQKNRLRQNIPSPQFIPLILSFEQKKLERAAVVLRDSQTRAKYDKYLRHKASQRRRENQSERVRVRLLQQAREVVNSLLNPDKTLDDSNRPVLAARLRELGIGESRITSLLRRIPGPAEEATRSGDEAMEYFVAAVDLAMHGNVLTPEAERTVMKLAKKLNIDDGQAANKIDQELRARNAHRGRRDMSMLEREFENRVCSMVPDGSATADQYELLLALARADNLPETSAREVLRRCLGTAADQGLAREKRGSDSGKSIREKGTTGVAGTENRAGKTEHGVEIRQRTRRRRKALPIALTMVALGCFVLSVWFLGMNGIRYVRQLVSPTPQTPSVESDDGHRKQQQEPDIAADRKGTPAKEQPEPGDDGLAPQPVQKSLARTEEHQEHRITASTGRSALFSGRLLITAEDVRRAYSASTRTEELLADLAMTMFACYCRATHFALGSTDCYDQLRAQMREPSRPSYLTAAVTLMPMTPVTAATQSAPPAPAQPESKTARAKSKSRSTPDPIEQLRAEDTPEAADKLLNNLKKRSMRSPGRIEMVARILRALSTMSHFSIPQRLIEMLPRSSPEVAFQITRTLARASGTNPSPGRLTSGLLTPVNTPAQRQRCAEWWKSNRPAWGQAQPIRFVPSVGASPPAGQTTRGRQRTTSRSSPGTRPGIPQLVTPTPTVKAPAWEPDPSIIKLLAVAAHYAEITGEALKNHKWGAVTPVQAQGPGTNMAGVTCSASEVGTDLLDSLNDVSNELSLIITEHPDYEKTAPMIDAITLHEKDPRTAACQSQLQKAVVNLDATAELLIVLIRQTDPNNELERIIAKIEEDRSRALSGAFNVVHELRESCYHNLILWDTLVAHNLSAAMPSPTGFPVRRVQR